MPRLILTYKNKVIRNYMVSPGDELIIGRDPACNMIIDHPSVSGRHARIRQSGKGLDLTDLGSTNGTFVNEDKVVDCQLSHQDWILIGKHVVIVDFYETLSLEATVQMLITGASGASDAEGTMLLDMAMLQGKSNWTTFDYLSFIQGDLPDLELSNKPVAIGKNQDAEIVITGIWAWFAGQPSATITRQNGEYILEHVAGLLKPKLNGMAIQGPIKLRHHDVITIGPIKMQLYAKQ